MVEICATAMIAPDITGGAAIGDVQLSAAMAAAQQPRQQRLAAAYRPAAHEALAVGIVTDQTLIPLELGPADIAFVMIPDQNLPGAALLAKATHNAFAAGFDRHPA